MAENFQVSLTDRMKTGPYSISTDGSNDAEDKQFPIVVRSLNRKSGLVQSELLAVPVCQDSGTGENIFGLIQEELTGRLIPWEHCLSLGCDNAPVMTGRHKGVYAFVKEQQPQIYLSGCTLHIVHNAAKKAAAELPPVETVLVDLFYYFNKSASRQQRFKGTQELYGDEVKKMLKHVSTRWLSIGRCLERLLTNWDTLKIFFKEEVDQLKKAKTTSAYASSKADSIFQFVRSPTNQLYVNFMLFVVKSLEPFLLTFQDEKPQIHKLRRSIQRLYKQIMVKFLKPSSLPVGVCLEDVDYKSSDNQRDDDDIAIGDAARSMIENKEVHHLRESRIKEFFPHVRGYYTTLLEYLMSRLPATHSPITSNGEGNTPFLSLVEVADVDLQAEVKFTSLRQLLIRFPVLMPSGCNMDKIGEQFSLYQCSDVNKHKTDRLDATWANIGGDTSLEMEELSLVMRGILVIPHSSAHCERIFSCVRKNKTSERSSLSSQTLESLLVLKNTKSKDIQNMSLDTLRQLKSAYADSLKDDADTD